MFVEFSTFGNTVKKLENGRTNYVLPGSGKIIVKDLSGDFFSVNQKPYNAGNIIEISDENIVIEADGERCEVKVLSSELPHETIVAYRDLCELFERNFNKNKEFSYEDMEKAFYSKNKDSLILCSFERKFDELESRSNREEIISYLKYLPHIFYQPRIHLKQIEDIRPASIVTRIGPEAIRHLASHSEHWKGIKVNGLIPERLLAKVLEDDFAIYENKAVKTLIDKLHASMKKEREETIDCKAQTSLNDSFSLNREQQNVHDAFSVLIKGLKDTKSVSMQESLDKILKEIEQILYYISKCKAAPLYRFLKRAPQIKGALKQTNIFMMDSYYKRAYELWNILGQSAETDEPPQKETVKEEYFVYCELLFVFALHFFNFKLQNTDLPILRDDKFNNVKFSFKDWMITLNTENTDKSDRFFTVEIKKKKEFRVEFIDIKLPDKDDLYKKFSVRMENNSLIFEKKPSDPERNELAKQLSEFIDNRNKKQWKNIFMNQLSNGIAGFSDKNRTIAFFPWKYPFPDNAEEIRETVRQLKTKLPSGYDECYILTIGRPNEIVNVEDFNLLSSLDSYCMHNINKTDKNFGIIPVGINDINSFRRFTKIILKNMILVDEEHIFCPICGEKMRKSQNGYICNTCNLQIIETRCPDCKKTYLYTKYQLPKTLDLKSDLPGMNVLLEENSLGFKNITNLEILDDKEHGVKEIKKPICPYCKQ